jgi:hypothetical protein
VEGIGGLLVAGRDPGLEVAGHLPVAQELGDGVGGEAAQALEHRGFSSPVRRSPAVGASGTFEHGRAQPRCC